MNKTDISIKLATTEANLKKWETRLKRATTKVTDLGKQRRRYQLALLSADQPVIATVKVQVPKPERPRAHVELANPMGTLGPAIREAAEDAGLIKDDEDTTLPDFLNRADPLIAEKMTAARKAAEAEARKAMPLTGRAALDYIKRKKK